MMQIHLGGTVKPLFSYLRFKPLFHLVSLSFCFALVRDIYLSSTQWNQGGTLIRRCSWYCWTWCLRCKSNSSPTGLIWWNSARWCILALLWRLKYNAKLKSPALPLHLTLSINCCTGKITFKLVGLIKLYLRQSLVQLWWYMEINTLYVTIDTIIKGEFDKG